MRPAESCPEDEQGIPRSNAEQVTLYGLWLAATCACPGIVLAFGVDLHLPGNAGVVGSLSSAFSLLPGLILLVSFVLGIRAIRGRRFWPACRFAFLSLFLAIAIGLAYISGLGGACHHLSGCDRQGAVLDLVATSQFLFVLCFASTFVASMSSLGVAIVRSRPLY